jgi:hypothetical protein
MISWLLIQHALTLSLSLSTLDVFIYCIILLHRNPINTIRHQFAADIAKEEKERKEREKEEILRRKEEAKRVKEEMRKRLREEAKLEKERLKEEASKKRRYSREPLDVSLLTPDHTEYWAEGIGKGGEQPWKFSCICGEKCSSYENYRYHPQGRMFECTNCSIWSHVECLLGKISNEDLEELPVSRVVYVYEYCILLSLNTLTWPTAVTAY